MLNTLFPYSSPASSPTLTHRLKNTKVHHVIAIPIIFFLSCSVAIFSTTIRLEQNSTSNALELGFYIPSAKALEMPKKLSDFTSIDIMKLTKDNLTNQPSDAEIESILSALSPLHAKYVALSIPLDATTDYPKTNIPAPRTAEDYTQAWADAAHRHGLHIIWRGTWNGLEGLYNFPKRVGAARFPAGTAANAASEGTTTWLGKTYTYITSHPSYFASGDIWAPLPERTEGIFTDSGSFLPTTGGIQTNYTTFFKNLKTVSDQAFAVIQKKAYTGWSANNFSEAKSGWLSRSTFDNAGLVVVDHYGITHTPEEMENDLRSLYQRTGQQIFLGEWSDYWDGKLPTATRQAYLDSMYGVFQKLADQGILAGFNYWGGWSGGSGEGILEKTTSGYQLNSQGQRLAQFYANNQ